MLQRFPLCPQRHNPAEEGHSAELPAPSVGSDRQHRGRDVLSPSWGAGRLRPPSHGPVEGANSAGEAARCLSLRACRRVKSLSRSPRKAV